MPKYQLSNADYPLKFAEVKKLFFATASFRDRCLVKSLFWAGLRREEAAKLDVRDIDFERKRITLKGKRGKSRTVPAIDDEPLSDIIHLVGNRNKRAVFVDLSGERLSITS